MKTLLYSIAIAAILSACSSGNTIYEEHKALSPELEWKKQDARTFEVEVTDVSVPYTIKLAFRYASGFQYKTMNVTVQETTPSGSTTNHNVSLKIINDKGDYIGEPGLDIWDSEHSFLNNVQFTEPGTYTYTIQHNMPQDPINMAMEVGLIVEREQP